MRDKELLRLAAIAAEYCGIGMPQEGESDGTCADGTPWNPLTDDGDALRLAVKLGFDIDRTAQGWVTIHCCERGMSFGSVLLGADPSAATRRAIARAAAQLAPK